MKAAVEKLLLLILSFALWVGQAVGAETSDWHAVLEKARGQTVYWNAWGGDPRINRYIAWAAEQTEARYGVEVVHVKLSDTGEAVARVLAEKSAGRDSGGSVDLIWLNGENFAAMKSNGLLHGPWSDQLPNFALVNPDSPLIRFDFTVPVEGMEAPWGRAQIVFMYDSAIIPKPPRSMHALLAWAKRNRGRFTYPQPPDFLGSTFLKQALVELAPDPTLLMQPVDESGFAAATGALWPWLDELHTHLWRGGRVFPPNGPAQRRLLGDGEIDMAVSFQPSEASAAIARGEIPDTVRTFVLANGTIGNASFVAIPFNARAREGAMVLANFLLSPEAQARKQDPRFWGGLTVLDMGRLGADGRAHFDLIEQGVATLSPDELGEPLPEPHPTWMEHLERAWQHRYAAGS